jgi:hypothetical protein
MLPACAYGVKTCAVTVLVRDGYVATCMSSDERLLGASRQARAAAALVARVGLGHAWQCAAQLL